MKIVIVVILLTYSVQLSAKVYPASELALVAAQSIDGKVLGRNADLSEDPPAQAILDGLERCIASVQDQVDGPRAMGVDGAIGSILRVIGEQFLKARTARKIKKLERLKKLATSSYSLEFVLDDDISGYDCGYISRSSVEKGSLNAFVVFRINHSHQGLIYIEPTEVWAQNTVAHTRKVNLKKNETETVGFLLSASLQGVQDDALGVPQLFSTGSDVRFLENLEIRENKEKPSKQLDLIKIGPIPTISNTNAKLLRIAVTEQGDIGFNVEDKIARTQALSEAIGPIILQELESNLEKAGLK